MATQMKLKGFFWQEIAWPPGLLERKNNKVESFLTLFFMSTLTWITEKELEQVLENKGEKFCWWKFHSGSEKMRNASRQQGAASKVKMSGIEKIKSEQKH